MVLTSRKVSILYPRTQSESVSEHNLTECVGTIVSELPHLFGERCSGEAVPHEKFDLCIFNSLNLAANLPEKCFN